MGNYIIANVKRCNRNLFIINILALIGVLLVLFLTHRYLFNVFFGPFEMASSELGNINDIDSLARYYVTIEGSNVYDTGMADIEKKYNKSTGVVTETKYVADYLLLTVNNKVIVVRAPHEKGNLTKQTGELKRLPEDVESDILDIIAKQGISRNAFKAGMLPILIDSQNDFKTSAYFEMSICIVLLILTLWNLSKFFIRTVDYNRHPIIKELSKYGDLQNLAREIDKEVIFGEKGNFANATITDSWLFMKTFYSLKILSLNDVVWIYKKVTKHSVNFIPTGKTYELIINTRYGKSINIRMDRNESRVDNAMNYIINKIPWIVAGFSEELKNLWVRNHNEMTAYVDDRRNQCRSIEQDNSPEITSL